MNVPPAQPIDLVTLAIAVIGAFFGAEVGGVAGPYAVILVSAIGGASWSLATSKPTDTPHGLVHMACMVGLALILTVPCAEALARMADINVRWVLAPMAAVIAARPAWVIAQLRSIVGRRAPARREGDAP